MTVKEFFEYTGGENMNAAIKRKTNMNAQSQYRSEVAASLRRQEVNPQRLTLRGWRYAVLAIKTGQRFKQPQPKVALRIIFYNQQVRDRCKKVI